MFRFDEEYCLDTFRRLLDADSTTGMYEKAEEAAASILEELEVPYRRTRKGGIIADLGGEGDTLCVTAHLDDIGLMVRSINLDGTLKVCPVGGLYPFYCITENVRLYTVSGKTLTGTVCRNPSSVHVGGPAVKEAPMDFTTNICVVLDEDVRSDKDAVALGVGPGDIIALEPRMTVSNGYIKSRFIDDKACAAVLLTLMREMKRAGTVPKRHVIAYFSVYEEIGHGTSYLPEGVTDILSVDIAPTGPEQTSDEHKVSIFAKDSRYPYHRGFLKELTEAAEMGGADYAVDVFTPNYGSDGDVSLLAGYDIRHAAIGPGTANSHGYERTHIDGLRNTFLLLSAYIAG